MKEFIEPTWAGNKFPSPWSCLLRIFKCPRISVKNARLINQFLSLSSSHSSDNSLFFSKNSITLSFRLQNLSNAFPFASHLTSQNNNSSPDSLMA
jgi:hypothetical protein